MEMEGLRLFEKVEDLATLSIYEQLISLPELVGYSLGTGADKVSKSKKICIFGMGESSIAGDMISAFANDNSEIPIPCISNGVLPGWIDEDTDTILVSYNGKNKVINAIYDKLNGSVRNLYCIVNKGPLLDKCQNDGNIVIRIPDGLTSRTAMGFELGTLATMIQAMGVCDARDRLEEIIPVVKEYRDSLFTDVRIERLKQKLHDTTIAIYGSPDFRPSFKRWKMSFNEDMGSPAFCGELPEFNHNEIVGWANHNQDDEDLRIVFLRGKYKNEILTTIIDKTVDVLEESNRHVIDLKILGSDPFEKNLRAILLGDFVSKALKYEGRVPMSWRGL